MLITIYNRSVIVTKTSITGALLNLSEGRPRMDINTGTIRLITGESILYSEEEDANHTKEKALMLSQHHICLI